MNDLKLLVEKIEDIVIKEGYAPILDYSISLSGYEIYKYYIEKAEKYKLGFSDSPLLSYAIPRMIYDGIAYRQYMYWDIQGDKNYYYFRRNYAKTLDIAYAAMSLEELGCLDYLIVHDFFERIATLCNNHLKDDYYIHEGEDNIEDLQYVFEKMHFLGRSIYSCWKEGNCPRFRFVKRIIDDSFNPYGI
jgi:hypothetical protein